MLWSLSPYWPLIAGVLGALLGSFGNVVIHRLPKGQSLAWPSSRCPDCAFAIPPHHNIPIVSYLFLRGRCASCQNPISLRYPLVEATTAVGCAITALLFPLHQSFVGLHFIAIVPLLVITVGMWIDGHEPDLRLTAPLMLAACAAVVIGDPRGFLPGIISAGVFGAIAGGGLAVITGIRPPFAVIGLGGAIGVLLGPWSLPLLGIAVWHFRLRKALAGQ